MDKTELLGEAQGLFLPSVVNKSKMFQPYQSSSMFFKKTASVVVAPVLFTVYSIGFILQASWELSKAINSLIHANTAEAKKHGGESFAYAFLSVYALLLAILSPLYNLIDLIGGGIATLTNYQHIHDKPGLLSMS